jgi:hypothetical protein
MWVWRYLVLASRRGLLSSSPIMHDMKEQCRLNHAMALFYNHVLYVPYYRKYTRVGQKALHTY